MPVSPKGPLVRPVQFTKICHIIIQKPKVMIENSSGLDAVHQQEHTAFAAGFAELDQIRPVTGREGDRRTCACGVR